MKTNIAGWERMLRVLFGATLLVAGLVGFGGSEALAYRAFAVVLVLLGLDFIVTGALGFCPLYHKLGWSTASQRTEVK